MEYSYLIAFVLLGLIICGILSCIETDLKDISRAIRHEGDDEEEEI